MKILFPAILIYSLGVLILQSVSPNLFWPQLFFGLISLAVYLLISQLDYQILFSLHTFFSIGVDILLLLTYIIGELTRGTHRWIDLGFFSLQPSEIAKPFLIISFVMLYHTSKKNHFKYFWISILNILPLILIFFQPDLGTFLVSLSGLLIVFFSHWSIKKITLLVGVVSILVLPSYQFILKDYQKDRLISFINPYSDPLGKGYHVIQSVISVGSGGVLGKGLGQGSQSQLRFLPEQHTDFIFSSLSEELGLVGASMILFLYGLIYYRIYKVSQSTSDPIATSVSLGILGMLTFQVFINVGMNIGVAPVTGITLPLMSYGGSSLISSALLLGIVSSISNQNRHRLSNA